VPRALRPLLRCLAAAAVLAASAGPAHAQEPLAPTDELVALFNDVVFKTESGVGSGGKPVVKWTTPIEIYLHQDPGADVLRRLDTLTAQLSRLSGLPIRRVATKAQANLQLYFLPTAEIRNRMNAPRLNCGGKLRGKRGEWTITSADVFISTENPARTNHCLVEELSQILGLTNDTRLTDQTIFNDSSTRKALSIPDQILVKTLYDAALKPGMSVEDSQPIVRRVIEDLRARLIAAGAARDAG
jgi:hypothetical protein